MELEKIQFDTGKERTAARVAFFNIVCSGHGVKHWESASMRYWVKVRNEHG